MNRKYEFTGETMEFEGHTLRRIRYLTDSFPSIKKTEKGGWIESEHNLSHEGECRVSYEAKVFGHARVIDDAVVANATVKDSVIIKDKSRVSLNAIVGADTIVGGKSRIIGNCEVFFYADENYGQTNVETSRIYGETKIEATGTIQNSIIRNREYVGFLDIKDEKIGFEKQTS